MNKLLTSSVCLFVFSLFVLSCKKKSEEVRVSQSHTEVKSTTRLVLKPLFPEETDPAVSWCKLYTSEAGWRSGTGAIDSLSSANATFTFPGIKPGTYYFEMWAYPQTDSCSRLSNALTSHTVQVGQNTQVTYSTNLRRDHEFFLSLPGNGWKYHRTIIRKSNGSEESIYLPAGFKEMRFISPAPATSSTLFTTDFSDRKNEGSYVMVLCKMHVFLSNFSANDTYTVISVNRNFLKMSLDGQTGYGIPGATSHVHEYVPFN